MWNKSVECQKQSASDGGGKLQQGINCGLLDEDAKRPPSNTRCYAIGLECHQLKAVRLWSVGSFSALVIEPLPVSSVESVCS